MGNHWYTQEGKPLHKVAKSSGEGERDTNLRDARKLKLLPSFSTIKQVKASEGLNVWKIKQLLSAASTFPYTPGEDVKEWEMKVNSIARQIGDRTAARGNEVHNELERMFSDKNYTSNDVCANDGFHYIKKYFLENDWISEATFATKEYGGAVDLHSKAGKGIVVDFKTKEDAGKMKPNDDYCMQLAAYRMGLGLPNADCYNFFLCTTKREFCLHKYSEKDLERGYKMFTHLLEFWKLENNFGV